MATLNDVISCYNELVDEVNGHTASIDKLNTRIDLTTENVSAVSTAMASFTAKLEARLAQVEARLDELVQEHDVMMDTISSLLAAPTPTVEEASTVELKRVSKPTVVEEKKGEEEKTEQPAPTVVEETVELKRVGKKSAAQTVVEAPATAQTVVVEEAPAPTVVEEEKTVPTEAIAALKRASASAPKPKKTVTEIQKRAFARQYMVEHGAKVEDLRNPEKINETIASEEFTAWMNER